MLDDDREPATLPARILDEVFAHARECYPEECCGIVIGPEGGQPIGVVRCINIQNVLHQRGHSELDARHGFWADDAQLFRATRAAEGEGHSVLIIYHSHVDTEAYLSQADVDGALGPDGTPCWPGSAQLVVPVYEGEVQRAGLFDWDRLGRAFVGRRVRPEG